MTKYRPYKIRTHRRWRQELMIILMMTTMMMSMTFKMLMLR